MKPVFKRTLLLLFLFCDILLCVADTTTLNFIGVKPKNGDTLNYITIFNQFDWDATIYKEEKKLIQYFKCKPDTLDPENADKVELRTSFNVDSNLLNKTFILRYELEGSLYIRINGNEILKVVKPLKTKRFVFFEEEEEGYCYFTFPEQSITIDIIIITSDISKAVGGKFEIGELKRKDDKIKSHYLDREVSILILFFYLAIGIVLLILFLFHKQSLENFYFSFFCILYSLSHVDDLFSFSSFISALFSSLSAFSMGFLVTYLSIVLIDKIRSKKALIVFSIILFLLIIGQSVFQYYKVSSLIKLACGIYLAYNFKIGIPLLFKGSSKKKWEVKFIKYGFFSALFFIFGIFILTIIVIAFITKNNFYINSPMLSVPLEATRIVGLLIIPLTIAVIIGKRNGLNQQELTLQLSEIKVLSEQNLQKEKEKQIILSEQNRMLEEKVQERTLDLQHEKKIVETKNQEIVDSIEYALRIQTAILPPLRVVKQYLNDSFILYKPKDIVAGDFYWMETIDDLVLFAACDCTGHGVSGAMVSVLCNNALNRAVREYNLLQPAAILNKTTEIVIESFSKSEEEIKDGMDISICAYNIKTRTLEWAGANNPLWLIKDGEFVEIKGDKRSIGMYEDIRPFTNHQLTLGEGDIIYIFSDGYADQFGGENGERKLTKRGFKELILSIQNISMQNQGKVLDKFTTDYRGTGDQTDDILVMGVKL